ncbi:MAG TPA: DUF192 domain-containing protein [Anaerolineales bacterium]|nr:DUF192 domain-containing protein [Anaerolineales bacterium]
MRNISVVNETRPLHAELQAGYCSSFLCLLKGLMFRKSIPADWGLLLVYPSDSIVNTSIHMFFVPFDLGIVWVNQAGEVVDKARAKRWIGLKAPKAPASFILEIVPERLDEFEVGDKVLFKKI